MEVRLRMGGTFPGSRPLRGIDSARLSAIYPVPGDRVLVGRIAAFVSFWVFPRHQSRRNAGRAFWGRGHRSSLLPQPLVYRVAVVGTRLSRQLGLGGIVFLRHVGQRLGCPGAPFRGTPHRSATVERRLNRPGGQSAGPWFTRHHGVADVALVGTQSAVPLPR